MKVNRALRKLDNEETAEDVLIAAGFNRPYIYAHEKWWISMDAVQFGKRELHRAFCIDSLLPAPMYLIEEDRLVRDVRD